MVIPFGLKNAPAIFSRIAVSAFKDFIHRFLEVYFDHWTVFGLVRDHIENLRMMLERCCQYQIALNLRKISQCLLLFQEFDFEIIVNPGRLNVGLDHLSRIESGEEPNNLEDNLPDAQLFAIDIVDKEFDAIIHLLNTGYAPEYYTTWKKKQLVVKAADYMLIT